MFFLTNKLGVMLFLFFIISVILSLFFIWINENSVQGCDCFGENRCIKDNFMQSYMEEVRDTNTDKYGNIHANLDVNRIYIPEDMIDKIMSTLSKYSYTVRYVEDPNKFRKDWAIQCNINEVPFEFLCLMDKTNKQYSFSCVMQPEKKVF